MRHPAGQVAAPCLLELDGLFRRKVWQGWLGAWPGRVGTNAGSPRPASTTIESCLLRTPLRISPPPNNHSTRLRQSPSHPLAFPAPLLKSMSLALKHLQHRFHMPVAGDVLARRGWLPGASAHDPRHYADHSQWQKLVAARSGGLAP